MQVLVDVFTKMTCTLHKCCLSDEERHQKTTNAFENFLKSCFCHHPRGADERYIQTRRTEPEVTEFIIGEFCHNT